MNWLPSLVGTYNIIETDAPGIRLQGTGDTVGQNPIIQLVDIQPGGVVRNDNTITINNKIILEFNAEEDINRWETYLRTAPQLHAGPVWDTAKNPAPGWAENHERPGNEAGGFFGGPGPDAALFDAMDGGGRRKTRRKKRRRRTRRNRRTKRRKNRGGVRDASRMTTNKDAFRRSKKARRGTMKARTRPLSMASLGNALPTLKAKGRTAPRRRPTFRFSPAKIVGGPVVVAFKN